MLGIGLVLFCLRGLKPGILWNEKLLSSAFWSLNIGLALMGLLTLLPIGTLQLLAAIDEGYWYARSAEFMHQPLIELLVWLRMPGDVVFSVGAVLIAWFVIGLWVSPKRDETLPSGTKPAGG
jgi:nitric oxide reductase subunit B